MRCRSPGTVPSGTRVKAKTSVASSVPVVSETSRVSQVGFMDLKSDLNDIKANILSLSADIKNLHLPSVQNISATDFTRRSYSSVVGQLRDKSQGVTTAAEAGARVGVRPGAVPGVPIDIRSTIQTEVKAINRRSSNVIVSGLKSQDSMSDSDLFKDLCLNTFDYFNKCGHYETSGCQAARKNSTSPDPVGECERCYQSPEICEESSFFD